MNLQRCCTENNPKGFFLGDVIEWSGCIGILHSVHIPIPGSSAPVAFTISWVDESQSKLEPGERLKASATLGELTRHANPGNTYLQVLYGEQAKSEHRV